MKTYLRPRQIKEFKDERASLEAKLSNDSIQNKGAVRNQLRRLEQTIEIQTPPDLEGEALDNAVREELELREEITHGMLSDQEMRANAPGAVGHFMRWQKAYKTKILHWKNLRLTINKGSDDPDVANLDQFCPKRNLLNLDNAQVPIKTMSMPTEGFKRGYDEVDWDGTGSTVQKDQALLSEIEKLTQKIAKLEAAEQKAGGKKTRKKRVSAKQNVSPEERKRRSDHMKAVNARKREAALAAPVQADTQPSAA